MASPHPSEAEVARYIDDDIDMDMEIEETHTPRVSLFVVSLSQPSNTALFRQVAKFQERYGLQHCLVVPILILICQGSEAIHTPRVSLFVVSS